MKVNEVAGVFQWQLNITVPYTFHVLKLTMSAFATCSCMLQRSNATPVFQINTDLDVSLPAAILFYKHGGAAIAANGEPFSLT